MISFCGRPIAPLAAVLHPATHILALSADARTPAAVADFLCDRGFGPSEIVLLEALGGPHERIRRTTAAGFDLHDPHPLNLLAITPIADAHARIIPLAPGLDDGWFEHDGQITKREIRAATLSALAPTPRRTACGTSAPAPARSESNGCCHHPANTGHRHRSPRPNAWPAPARNAERLGVPGVAPGATASPTRRHCAITAHARRHLHRRRRAGAEGVIDTAWSALAPPAAGSSPTRSPSKPTPCCSRRSATHGGTLTRIGVERLDANRRHARLPSGDGRHAMGGDAAMIVAGIGCRRLCEPRRDPGGAAATPQTRAGHRRHKDRHTRLQDGGQRPDRRSGHAWPAAAADRRRRHRRRPSPPASPCPRRHAATPATPPSQRPWPWPARAPDGSAGPPRASPIPTPPAPSRQGAA